MSNVPEEENTSDIMKQKKARLAHQDTIRGSLIGGAAGDALGYPVEFMSLEQIRRIYGKKGIRRYDPDPMEGKALISDDTQMALFTAVGILNCETEVCMDKTTETPDEYVWYSYKAWLRTQRYDKEAPSYKEATWLDGVSELYARRAPGNTCLVALSQDVPGTVDSPVNNSKGCGGVMRVAPLGLFYDLDWKKVDMEGAAIAALTHGHPLGYLPAAMLTHILNQITWHRDQHGNLKDIVADAERALRVLFPEEPELPRLLQLTDLAVTLSENKDKDEENIHELGEGWVAEETLAIAVYCALRHVDDFSAGITAAVNHNGDSDSTGAVAGNILGAWLGYSAVADKWKKDLQLADIILEVADDLCQGCLMQSHSSYRDPAWETKYIDRKPYHA